MKEKENYQIAFQTQYISTSVFLQPTFEEIVNLYKKLLTLQLKTVQKRGTFVKELIKIGNICPSVVHRVTQRETKKKLENGLSLYDAYPFFLTAG